MTVDDDFWDDVPKLTVGRRINVYFLRFVLLPIIIVVIIYELIDMKISFGKFNGIGAKEEDLTKFKKRHPISGILHYIYSDAYLKQWWKYDE